MDEGSNMTQKLKVTARVYTWVRNVQIWEFCYNTAVQQ